MAEKTNSSSEIINNTKGFLQSINYIIEDPEIPKEFMGKPDFYAKKQDGVTTLEICGLVKNEIKDIPRAITHLWTIKKQLGNQIDYIIVIPPVEESSVIEFLQSDNKKWLKKIKREKFHIWLSNSETKDILAVYGTPSDENIANKIEIKTLEIE